MLATALAAATLALVVETRMRVVAERLDVWTFWCLLGALTLGAATLAVAVPVVHRRRMDALTAILATGFMVGAGELTLRTWPGNVATYLERSEGRTYELQYHHTSPARYHVLAPGTSYTIPRAEFAFPRVTNSLGLSEREVPQEKAANELRLLALGDSYTEGVGTPYEGTWLKAVERHAAAALPARQVTSFNGGVSGSDPWYGLVLLEDKLLPYRADVVFVAINASDVNDVIIRGGRERFGADGITRPRPTPWWEWIYGVSFMARHVVHDVLGYNSLFIKESRWQDARREAGAQLLQAVRAYQTLAARGGFRLVVVIHPDKREASRARYERGFAAFVAEVKALPGIEVVDVLDRWSTSGVLTANSAASLYWPIDGHNTPEGYAAFGRAVADAVFPPAAADTAATSDGVLGARAHEVPPE